MANRRYHSRGRKHRPKQRPVEPGSDSRLKKVFAEIGTPEKTPFRPDPFQSEAVAAIRKGDCLVTAPTGAGKTWIAVEAIRHIFENGGRAWYASPLKALTNSKYTEFGEIFGSANLGILTGDRKENPDAPIIVGTTEILRNQLYDAMHRGENLATDLVVLDEAHYLGDEERGVVWEETMIYLPSRIPILMLSATIGNADDIAGWLESIRSRKCIIVEENQRPVPLFPLFLHPAGTLYPLFSQAKDHGRQRLYKKVIGYVKKANTPKARFSKKLPAMSDILRVLRHYNLLPAIFFLKSRADCDNAVMLCRSYRTSEDEKRREGRIRRITELAEQAPHIMEHRQMRDLKNKGIAAHHSGHLPAWKLMVETLMTEGYLDAVFATSTVAAGVNFPARTILFLNSDRFNGREFVSLSPTQFHQMTGRAGRRGMDNIGFAVVIPGRFMDIPLVAELVHAPASDVVSQIKINFSMTLNLLLSHTPPQVKEMLDKSFATYLHKTRPKKRKKRDRADTDTNAGALWEDFLHHLDFLKENRYVTEDNRLTEDGEWASQLRIDHPLMVAEGFRRRLFPETDPAFLAGIMAAFVNERDTDDESIDPDDIPDDLFAVFETVNRGLSAFAGEMAAKGFSAPLLFFRPTLTLFYWAKGLPWEDVLDIWGSAEGDLAMLILRTADNLRHIRNLADVFPEAATAARQAIDLVLREPVIATPLMPTSSSSDQP